MTADSSPDPQAPRRSWVVLLYFYLAALVGLGFVVGGVTTALFGVKDALLPGLGVSRYAYQGPEPYYDTYPGPAVRVAPPRTDDRGEVLSELRQRRQREARERAVDERRRSGIDGLLSGLILTAVGLPVLVWHLRRGRAINGSGATATAPTPPTPTAAASATSTPVTPAAPPPGPPAPEPPPSS